MGLAHKSIAEHTHADLRSLTLGYRPGHARKTSLLAHHQLLTDATQDAGTRQTSPRPCVSVSHSVVRLKGIVEQHIRRREIQPADQGQRLWRALFTIHAVVFPLDRKWSLVANSV